MNQFTSVEPLTTLEKDLVSEFIPVRTAEESIALLAKAKALVSEFPTIVGPCSTWRS